MKGWTQDQAAEVFGISRSAIAGYESESKFRIPRPETLNKIAQHFGVSVDYLLGYSERLDGELSEVGREFTSRILELSDEELMEKITFLWKGKPVSEEKKKLFIEFMKIEEENRRKKKAD